MKHEYSFWITDRRFKGRASQIVFASTLLNKIVHRFTNRYQEEYERRWAWIFPAWLLYFELEVVK